MHKGRRKLQPATVIDPSGMSLICEKASHQKCKA